MIEQLYFDLAEETSDLKIYGKLLQACKAAEEELFRANGEEAPHTQATIHPDIKRTLVAISERTGMCVSQVTDEVLYTGLVEMQEL